MLTVHIPDNCLAERRYIVSLVFEQFLGIPIRILTDSRAEVVISGPDGQELVLADIFFPLADRHWLTAKSMPPRPLRQAVIPDEIESSAILERELPVVFGDPFRHELQVPETSQRRRCSVDILGSAFFLISRYEELVTSTRDDHARFPAEASLAFQEGFLDRPIVDEYMELLWWLISQQWPGLQRKQHRYRLILSHDVDTPYRVLGRPAWHMAVAAAADVASGRGTRFAVQRLLNACRVYRGDTSADPYDTFDFIMSTSEAHSLQSAFYFITRRQLGRLDGTHHFGSPLIQQLLRAIHARGHEIGLHPGYGTFRNPADIADELALLRQQCDRLGVRQSIWGGRQHYLRWDNPTTWAAWNAAGLTYDSSVGYARDVGFRCGTCREYPVYDLIARCPLDLRERPLIVMECAISFRNPKPDPACYDRVVTLVERCRKLRGDFTLLWHNNNLITAEQREWYRKIIATAA